ncbi:MAG: GNAT family N-acetyltransferase [Candidatus Zixiibacteriota bacterium]
MRQVLVTTERLLIRRPEASDLALMRCLFCDQTMMKYLGGVWSEEQTADALQEWHDHWGINNRWYGTLLLKESGDPIGTAGFTQDTIPDEPGLELSWFVLPQLQGRGLATEITQELLRCAFEELGADRMVGETHPGNPSSTRVLQKLGFECLGERHNTYDFLPGIDRQMLWALTKEMWQSQINPAG